MANIDGYLASIGLWRKPTAKDGTCLFRVLSEQLFHTQVLHHKVRQDIVDFMRRNYNLFQQVIPEMPLEEHLQRISKPNEFGGRLELFASSILNRHDVVIYTTSEKLPIQFTNNGYKKKVSLCYEDGFYDSLYPRHWTEAAGICQSIVYEVLYKAMGVENPVSIAQKLQDEKEIRIAQRCKNSLDDDVFEASSGGNNKKGFTTKVIKALVPTMYRNVEYDTWLSAHSRPGRQPPILLAVGDKCKVILRGFADRECKYDAHVQHISPDNGPVTVFVHELGQRWAVAYKDIIHLQKERPHERRKKNIRDMQETIGDMENMSLHTHTERENGFRYPNFGEEIRLSYSSPKRQPLHFPNDQRKNTPLFDNNNTTPTLQTLYDDHQDILRDPSAMRYFINLGLETYYRNQLPQAPIVYPSTPQQPYYNVDPYDTMQFQPLASQLPPQPQLLPVYSMQPQPFQPFHITPQQFHAANMQMAPPNMQMVPPHLHMAPPNMQMMPPALQVAGTASPQNVGSQAVGEQSQDSNPTSGQFKLAKPNHAFKSAIKNSPVLVKKTCLDKSSVASKKKENLKHVLLQGDRHNIPDEAILVAKFSKLQIPEPKPNENQPQMNTKQITLLKKPSPNTFLVKEGNNPTQNNKEPENNNNPRKQEVEGKGEAIDQSDESSSTSSTEICDATYCSESSEDGAAQIREAVSESSETSHDSGCGMSDTSSHDGAERHLEHSLSQDDDISGCHDNDVIDEEGENSTMFHQPVIYSTTQDQDNHRFVYCQDHTQNTHAYNANVYNYNFLIKCQQTAFVQTYPTPAHITPNDPCNMNDTSNNNSCNGYVLNTPNFKQHHPFPQQFLHQPPPSTTHPMFTWHEQVTNIPPENVDINQTTSQPITTASTQQEPSKSSPPQIIYPMKPISRRFREILDKEARTNPAQCPERFEGQSLVRHKPLGNRKRKLARLAEMARIMDQTYAHQQGFVFNPNANEFEPQDYDVTEENEGSLGLRSDVDSPHPSSNESDKNTLNDDPNRVCCPSETGEIDSNQQDVEGKKLEPDCENLRTNLTNEISHRKDIVSLNELKGQNKCTNDKVDNSLVKCCDLDSALNVSENKMHATLDKKSEELKHETNANDKLTICKENQLENNNCVRLHELHSKASSDTKKVNYTQSNIHADAFYGNMKFNVPPPPMYANDRSYSQQGSVTSPQFVYVNAMPVCHPTDAVAMMPPSTLPTQGAAMPVAMAPIPTVAMVTQPVAMPMPEGCSIQGNSAPAATLAPAQPGQSVGTVYYMNPMYCQSVPFPPPQYPF